MLSTVPFPSPTWVLSTLVTRELSLPGEPDFGSPSDTPKVVSQ